MIEALSSAITAIFLIVILSYYFLLFVRKPEVHGGKLPKSLTIVIPAHNEERFIAECIDSVLHASFKGTKEIIVVDDGSKDRTSKIAKTFKVTVLRTAHKGKSNAINLALSKAKGELIAIVDADSTIDKDAFVKAIEHFRDSKVAAVCSVIKVKNRKSFLGMWLHIEQLYNSLLRSLFAKVNVNIVTPGPLSMYRKAALEEMNGFDTKGFSEDVDVALRLIKRGYKISCCEQAYSHTNMPVSPNGFAKQRTRFARGWINIFKRHLRFDRRLITIYTLPLMLFGYFQAVVMGSITLYKMISGYIQYFASQGHYWSFEVLRFFIDWLSIKGTVQWSYAVISNLGAASLVDLIGVSATLLSYPLYLVAIFKYDKQFTMWHLLPLLFMQPFWLLIMVFYMANLWEIFNPVQKNIWSK